MWFDSKRSYSVILWKLNELMANRRESGKDLANFLGITEASVSRLRQSRTMPRLTARTLGGLCEFLKCTPGDLLEYVANPPNNLDLA